MPMPFNLFGPVRSPQPVPSSSILAGSFLPTFFGVQLGLSPNANADPNGELLSPEQAQQAFLSRLLLLLGSFVILCLLLF